MDAARVEAAGPSLVAAEPPRESDPWRESWPRAYRAPLLAALLVAAAIALIWLAPDTVLDGAERAIEAASERNDATGRAMLTTLLVALALLSLVVRWGARSSPRRAVRLPDGAGRLPVQELEMLLRHELTAPAAVEDAHVRVENWHRRGVRVDAVVEVAPETRLSEAGREARDRLADVVYGRLGLELAAPPRVELRYRELWLRPPGGEAREAEWPSLRSLDAELAEDGAGPVLVGEDEPGEYDDEERDEYGDRDEWETADEMTDRDEARFDG